MKTVEMINIVKKFPSVIANDNVNFDAEKGEIHAILGENGAGKSTLMSILFGLYHQDQGVIKINGEEVEINDPRHANQLGIGMVHQHFKLVDIFTVAENILLGAETRTKFGLDVEKGVKKIIDQSELYNLKVDPYEKIENISVGMQQRVEILKMLYRDAEILIFDEPTAVLTPQEIEELMTIMRNLANEGKTIILITHKLKEIKQVADRCTVLRKGKYIGTVNVKETSVEMMAEMMVGRAVNFKIEKSVAKPRKTVLEMKNLTVSSNKNDKNLINNFSLEVRQGEIVCLAGIEGNGQKEIVEAIYGLRKVDSGELIFNGENITNLSIKKRILLGMAHIPEDRHKYGLVLDHKLSENLIFLDMNDPQFSKHSFLRSNEIIDYSKYLINKFDIRCGKNDRTTVRSMSGGNQQKAIIAREIERKPELLIAVQPTRGLDVGAIEFIHKELIKYRDENKAILLVSLELDEVFNISDTIAVIYEGELVHLTDVSTISENELGLYMSGSKRSVK